MLESLKKNWPEYISEAIGLGTFMVSAILFTAILFHRDFPFVGWNFGLRLMLTGVAMGLTLIGIIFSPFGQRSGAHLNPAFTLTFWRLGKIKTPDAVFYMIFQFIGGVAGVLLAWLLLGNWASAPEVNFAVTVPNSSGPAVSFAAEFIITFIQMTVVLITSNHPRLSRYTPFFAAAFLATYITFEAPISGMSMNPARTFASAIVANTWNGWWLYFVAPPLATLAAGEVFVRIKGLHAVLCAKLYHHNTFRCIFNCNFWGCSHDENDSKNSGPSIEVTAQEQMFAMARSELF